MFLRYGRSRAWVDVFHGDRGCFLNTDSGRVKEPVAQRWQGCLPCPPNNGWSCRNSDSDLSVFADQSRRLQFWAASWFSVEGGQLMQAEYQLPPSLPEVLLTIVINLRKISSSQVGWPEPPGCPPQWKTAHPGISVNHLSR